MDKLKYRTFRKAMRHRNIVFSPGWNGADGTTNDTSTDPVITRDPNNYILPRITSMNITHGLMITIGILAVIILLPIAIKTIKNFNNV